LIVQGGHIQANGCCFHVLLLLLLLGKRPMV
jgi:hypothetical protein